MGFLSLNLFTVVLIETVFPLTKSLDTFDIQSHGNIHLLNSPICALDWLPVCLAILLSVILTFYL